MIRLSPKVEIINHFDNLIHRVDIDIEQSIEKYNQHVFGEFECFPVENRYSGTYYGLNIECFGSNESSQNEKCEAVNEWSESTKVIEYLNQVRQRTIDELRKAQENSLKSESLDLQQLKESKDVEEMKSRLFADKFYFQVFYKPKFTESWVFNLFTIVVDFYLSPTDINYLEYLINQEGIEIEKCYINYSLILHEKFVLMQSLAQQFCETIKTEQFPSHVISFRKRDLLNIKDIWRRDVLDFCRCDCESYIRELFSNCPSRKMSSSKNISLHVYNYMYKHYLKQVRIGGLLSLNMLSLKLESIEESFFSNMYSLKKLALNVKNAININSSIKLFEICPNIEELALTGKFSNINLDSFIHLKKLSLYGEMLDGFNFDLFANICNQLEELEISFKNMNDESIAKLLYGHNFPNISYLSISYSKITRLEKKLFEGFPIFQSLSLCNNKEIETIDKDTFSNLKNLKELCLSFNQLRELDPELFLGLTNLEKLNLSHNRLTHFDSKILDYIVNIKEINLCQNSFKNRKEIYNQFKPSNINILIEIQ